MDRWHGPGTSNTQPLLNTKHTINNLNSEYYIEDGGFFRIRNVQLAYNFDKTLISRIGMQALKLYVNIQNLRPGSTTPDTPPNWAAAPFFFGVDDGSYPMPAIYTFRIQPDILTTIHRRAYRARNPVSAAMNKNNNYETENKILTLIAGTLTTFALTSCNDFLDRDPLGQFTEDDARTPFIGGKMYNVYYLMRSYNITAGIPAFMIHGAQRGLEKEAMPATAPTRQPCGTTSSTQLPTVRSAPTGGRTIKSSTNATKYWTIWKTAKTKTIRKMAYQRRSPVLPRLLLLQPGARLGRSALVTFKVGRSIRCQCAQDHCRQDIRTNRQRPDRGREMPAADMDLRIYRTDHMGSRPFTARPHLHDAQ